MSAIQEGLALAQSDLDALQNPKTQMHSVNFDDYSIAVQFNKKRNENTDFYAKVTFIPKQQAKDSETVEKDLFFGLFILGTEKHESRRIDNQLRGRAGRQ